jgi:hypothetical protein
MSQFKFAIHDKVRDPITTLQGVVIGRAEYLSYTQYLVQPNGLDKDGKPFESFWLDEDRLARVED